MGGTNAAETQVRAGSRLERVISWLRDAPWLNERRLTVYPRLFLAIYAADTAIWILRSHGLIDPGGHPIGGDFVDPWSASFLALSGRPFAVYTIRDLWAVERIAVGYKQVGFAGFHYPPMFLLFALPLA